MTTMKAAVIYEPGGPEVLKVETRPIPVPQSGEVLIRIKAFGLNRSELFTRQGIRQASSSRVCSASRQSVWWRKRPERNSPKATSSQPPWEAWGASSTADTPNIPACPRRTCKS